MKIWIKRLIILVIVLLVAIATATYFFSNTLLSSYRPEIERTLSSILGVDVKYDDIHIFLPLSELILTNLELKSVPDSPTVVNGKISRLSLRIDPFALLDHKLEVRDIIIDEPTANIQIIKAAPSTIPPTSTPPVVEIREAEFALPDFMREGLEIQGIKIQQGSVELVITAADSSKRTLAFNDITLDTDVAWINRAVLLKDFSLALNSLNGPEKIAASMELHELNFELPSRRIAINNGQIILDSQKFTIAGSSSVDFSEFALSLGASDLDLPRLSKLGTQFGVMPKIALNGKLGATIEVQSSAGTSTVTGDLKLQNFALNSSGVRIAGVSLTKSKFTFGSNGEIALTTTADLNSAVVKSVNYTYSATSARGPLTLSVAANKSMKINSDLSVRGFVYKDSETTLENVDADLSQVNCLVSSDGSTDLRLNLRGVSVVMRSSSVHIKKVTEVKTQLVVLIPAKGGYKVTGPVQVSDGELVIGGHALTKVSGAVDILVSGPVKRFTTRNLSATQKAESIQSAADFEMTAPSYKLKSLSAKIAGGALSGTFAMGRGTNRGIAVDVNAQNIDLSQAMNIVEPDKESSIDGLVQKFTLAVDGTKGSLPDSLTGTASLQVVNGIVNKLNVDGKLKDMLGSVPVIGSMFRFDAVPNSSTTKSDGTPSKYALKKFSARALTATFQIGGGKIATQDLLTRGQYGNTTVTGSYYFSDRLDMQGTVIFLEQSARSLAGPIKPLAGLFGSLGKIEIPLKITGKIEDPSVGVDTSRLLQVSAPGRIVGSAVSGVGGVISGIGGMLGIGGQSSSSSSSSMDSSSW